jgi:hypothetical protein
MDTFEIYLDLNENAIRTPIPGRHPIICPFVVQIGETWFPDHDWEDFTLAVLHQWQHKIGPLISGEVSAVTLVFMAGPFEMRVRAAGQNQWAIECVHSDTNHVYARGQCDSNLVCKEILLGLLGTLAWARKAGLSNDGCDALEAELKQNLAFLFPSHAALP